jgi:hypothetical protein
LLGLRLYRSFTEAEPPQLPLAQALSITMPSPKTPARFSITRLMLAVSPVMGLIFVCTVRPQESASILSLDPRIAAAVQEISPVRIHANIEKLVSFGTRSTLSPQDPASIAAGRGIGAAREWIKSEFERYSKECGGCLEVKTDSFTESPAKRIP